MTNYSIYQDMAERTDGCVYIGVVGSVRTGEYTLIKRMMEQVVIPNIRNDHKRERARDELPQSGSGRTIMTAEPKFVPEEPVEIALEEVRATGYGIVMPTPDQMHLEVPESARQKVRDALCRMINEGYTGCCA